MKVILSRKGFDSSNGGIVSPVFEDGTMLSFPIPSKDTITYEELVCNGVSLDKLLDDLGYKGGKYCHLDPDIEKSRRKAPVQDWKPAFGQINQAASYLINNGISKGDLFLFFGNFKHVKEVDGKYRYVHRNKNIDDDYYGRQFQAIWGYLQVGEVITDADEQKELFWHPHSCDERIYKGKNNMIFVASDRLSFSPDLPGCGVLPYDIRRVLSMPGKPKATWKKHDAYDLKNIESNRRNSAKNGQGIYYAGIWQELVLKENMLSENWAKDMLLCAK